MPSSKEVRLQGRVEELQQEVAKLNARASSRETQTGPRQHIPAKRSARIQDLQQQLRSQEPTFNTRPASLENQSSAQETKLSEEISPKPSSVNNSGDEPNTDAGIVSSSTDTATAKALSVGALHPMSQSSKDKSFVDALKRKPPHEMSLEEYGIYSDNLEESDEELRKIWSKLSG